MKSLVFGMILFCAPILHAQCGSSTGCNLANTCSNIFASMGCNQSTPGNCGEGYVAVDCNTGAALNTGCSAVASGCEASVSSGCGQTTSNCGAASSNRGQTASSCGASVASSGCGTSVKSITRIRTGWYLGKFLGR